MDVIYTDFSKAFDVVNHELIIKKLIAYGFTPLLLNWITTYLTNRKQYVLVNGVKSDLIEIQSGVPQGSHLGPLLFILFINDIGKVILHSNYLIYADDMKIFKPIRSKKDSDMLQSDIDSISRWCSANVLFLNIQKCNVMTFSRSVCPIASEYYINDNPINRVYCMRDLGVTFTPSLCFSQHIESVILKAFSMFGFIKRATRNFNDPSAVLTLYISLVRSQLEYSSIVWNPYYDYYINRLENIQKQFLIYFAFKFNHKYDNGKAYWENVRDLPSYIARCKDLNIETISYRREINEASFVADLLSGKIDCPILLSCLNIKASPKIIRHNQFFNLEFHRTNYGKNSAINSLMKSFNSNYDMYDFNLTKPQFKWALKNK